MKLASLGVRVKTTHKLVLLLIRAEAVRDSSCTIASTFRSSIDVQYSQQALRKWLRDAVKPS